MLHGDAPGESATEFHGTPRGVVPFPDTWPHHKPSHKVKWKTGSFERYGIHMDVSKNRGKTHQNG